LISALSPCVHRPLTCLIDSHHEPIAYRRHTDHCVTVMRHIIPLRRARQKPAPGQHGEAARLVRVAAAGAQAEAPGPALAGCWISPGWSTGLTVCGHPDWLLHEDPAAGIDGLAAVLVARKHRHGKVSVCGYLADLYCLGVKNALGPEIVDDLGLQGFVRDFFSGYDGDPVEVPIELAREVVLGSAGYARSLGFDPHPDFAAAEGHLGPWTGPGAITKPPAPDRTTRAPRCGTSSAPRRAVPSRRVRDDGLRGVRAVPG
jgi:hypothetical protein